MKIKKRLKKYHFAEKIVYHLRGLMTTQELIDRGMKVGQDFFRGHDVLLDNTCCWLLEMGDNVVLSDHVKIYCHDASTKKFLGVTKVAPVTIGSRVYVGAGAIILPGITIGSDVIIGAGAVVTHNIPDGMLAVGNPARVVSSVAEYLEKEKAGMAQTAVYSPEETGIILYSRLEKAAVRKQLEKTGIVYFD